MAKPHLRMSANSSLRIDLHRQSPPDLGERAPSPLTIPELEGGLRILDKEQVDPAEFWKDNLPRYRLTLLAAIADTDRALKSSRLTGSLRLELEAQLPALHSYLLLADRGSSAKLPMQSLRPHR